MPDNVIIERVRGRRGSLPIDRHRASRGIRCNVAADRFLALCVLACRGRGPRPRTLITGPIIATIFSTHPSIIPVANRSRTRMNFNQPS